MKRAVRAIVFTTIFALASSTAAFAATPQEAADELNAKGLFEGTGNGYELERQMTRAEAITMFVKILGKNDEAQNGTWTTPFTDVEDWAKPYVGYAYTNGLTSGISATQFGSKESVSYTQYLTFVLKALNYEVGKDFQWDKAYELSNQIGLTSGVGSSSQFLRGDAAVVSLATVKKAEGSENTNTDSTTTSGAITNKPSDSKGNGDNGTTSHTPTITKDDLKSMFTFAQSGQINDKIVYWFDANIEQSESDEFHKKWWANDEDDMEKAMTDFILEFKDSIEPLTLDITVGFEAGSGSLGRISYGKKNGVYNFAFK